MSYTTDELENITLSGSGVVAGGRYNRVKISGSGKINGEVDANELKIHGSASLKGPARINDITVNGSVKFHENVEAEKCVIKGAASSSTLLDIIELNIYGSLTGKFLRTTKLKNQGSLRADTVEAEEFMSHGNFNISHELNAHHIEVTLYGSSHAKEIGGDQIKIASITGTNNVWKKVVSLFSVSQPLLKSDVIEGTVIHLENTHAKVVRGEQIRIGPNCKIDCVEYLDTLEVSPEANVGKIVEA